MTPRERALKMWNDAAGLSIDEMISALERNIIEAVAAEHAACDRRMHAAMQAARGDEKEECARMVREHARAISKGSFPKPVNAEEWGEVLAKHIEIPF
jgi:hypothetical protein